MRLIHWSAFVLAAALLALAGCTSGGAGAAADNEDFAACVEDAGLSLDGADDWAQTEQQEFFSEPAALDCAATSLSDDERSDALQSAFPKPDGSDEEARAQQAAPVDALVAYVQATIGEVGKGEVVGRAARLIDALELEPDGAELAAREQVALTVVRETAGVPGYDRWLADHGVEDDYVGRMEYVIAAERDRTPAYDAIAEVLDQLDT